MLAVDALRCRVVHGALHVALVEAARDLARAGHPGGAKIDQLQHPVAVDQDVVRLEVEVHHLQAMETAQPLRDLGQVLTRGVDVGLRVVVYPLAQGLALDVFRHVVQEAPVGCVQHARHVRVVDAPSYPLLVQKASRWADRPGN